MIDDAIRTQRLSDASIECQYLDSLHPPGRARPWLLWPFHEAPPELRSLSTNHGDEDWILVLPPKAYSPVWADEGGAFGCCTVEDHALPCGRRVLIGCHA